MSEKAKTEKMIDTTETEQENAIVEAELDTALNKVIAEAEAEAVSSYVHHFKKPFLWMKKEYEDMVFNFEDLTGRDMQAIEREMSTLGLGLVSPAFSGEFLIRMAAKAAGIGEDAILAMPIAEAATIRSKARSFLLRSEL